MTHSTLSLRSHAGSAPASARVVSAARWALASFCLALAACGGGADAPPPPENAPVTPPTLLPPTITQQPASVSVTAGQAASFTMAATGSPTLTYQWQRNGTAIAGATGTTYALNTTALTDSGAVFRAVVTNSVGSATSNNATLTVTAAAPVLTITPQPADLSVAAGATATFTVGGTCSAGTLDIQWQSRASSAGTFANIAGATATSYSLVTASGDSGSQYRANLDCSGQSAAASSVATLTVTSAASVTLTAVPVIGLRAQADIPLIAGITMDPAGTYSFITNNRIKRLSADLSTINPVAGGTDPGAADGAAASASFNQPSELTVDAAGVLYVTDTGNQTIRKIAADGTVSTLAGSAGVSGNTDGTGSAARFNNPTGIALGADGDLYVADLGNQRIRRVTVAGVVSTYAGSSAGYADSATPLAAQFFGPYGVAVAANGDVLVADTGNSRIRRILRSGTVAGAVQTLAGGAASASLPDGIGAAAGFSAPRGIVLRGNTLTVRDFGRLRQVDLTTAAVTTFSGTRTPPNGTIGVALVDGPAASAEFRNTHFGITLAPAGGFMVAEDVSLRTVSAAGLVQTIASSSAIGITALGVGTLTQMPFGLADNSPQSVAIDPAGNIVIADGQAQLVRRIAPAGTVTLAAGLTGSDVGGPGFPVDGIGSAAQFEFAGPAVVSDASGVLYVADFFGVRRIAADNTTTMIAGSPYEHGIADGNAATARFGHIAGLALGAGGVVYAADYDNGTIRRIDASGNVTTYAGVAGSRSRVDGAIASARFHYPGQMAFAPDGALYVVDGDTDAGTSGVIRRIAPDGSSVSTVAGITLGGFGTSSFNGNRLPFAFAVAADGSIYYGGIGLMVLAPGASTPTTVIPSGSLTLGSSPRVANIMALTFSAAKQMILLSDGQILKVTLP